MLYSELIRVYEQLEKTPSKLKKTEIMAGMLRKTSPELLPKVVLLLTGRVFPAWSGEVLGVANQLMVRAVARGVGTDTKTVTRKFKETGDLGKTAEWLIEKKKQQTLLKKKLDVETVFSNMQSIARQTGGGSQDRKLNLVIELLSHASPSEARYLVRTVLEELRVGVAEGILRDSIAQAFGLEPSVVEKAWFLRPDYGEIARIAKEKGEAGLRAVRLELGKPIMLLLAEKSPDLKTAMEAYERFVIEFKYDGMRALIEKKGDKIWVFTRRLENVTSAFPDLVKLCRESIKARNCIIEGEVLGVDPKTGRPQPFQMLSTRIKRKYRIEQAAKEIPVQLNLFDMVYLDGKTFFETPLEERFEALKRIIKPIPGKVRFVQRLMTKDIKKAEDFYSQALSEGQEGVMVKNLDAKYVPGRRVAGGWLKVKPVMETLDLAITGATWGTGKRAGWLGSLILGCRDPQTGRFLECGMLGTGIKEKKTKPEDVTFLDITKMLEPLIESEKEGRVWIRPKIIIEVAYEEIQKSPTYSSGWALRFPRFIRMREDKSVNDCDTLARIEHLYNIQKGKE